jgi:outer membrane lipoprotein-sorting protein
MGQSRGKFYCITALLLIYAGFSLEAQSLSEMFEQYAVNQKKIKTFVGMGETKVEIYNKEGILTNNIRQPLEIMMKYPDFFKLTMTGNERVEMVQKGAVITQKIPGTNTVISQKADDKSDLFKKYFGYAVEGRINDRWVEKIDMVNEAGVINTRFTVNVPATGGMKIDHSDYYFNENSLLTRISIYSDGKEFVRTNFSYLFKDGIYAAAEIRTTTETESSKIISSIKYNTININTAVSDREFTLK